MVYLRSTEVTVREYLDFLVNNRFDPSLLPDQDILQELDLYDVFEDAKLMDSSRYFHVAKSMNILEVHLKRGIQKDKDNLINLKIFLPVTGVSYSQAVQFCAWRQSVYNSWTKRHIVEVRLPLIEEYKMLLEDLDSTEVNANGCRVTYNYLTDTCVIPERASSFSFSGFVRADKLLVRPGGVYNLQGNAAEMTAERGVSMGGSFLHYARQSFKDILIPYDKPEKWLGFRHVTSSRSR